MGKNIFVMAILLCAAATTYGQTTYRTAINSGSQNFNDNSSGYSISCSVGEPVVGSITSNAGDVIVMLDQGFQQGVSGVDLSIITINQNFDLRIYPNPVVNYLHLLFEGDESQEKFRIEILDLNGKTVITQDKLRMNEEYIVDTYSLVSGVYILRISSASKHIETVRFVKQ